MSRSEGRVRGTRSHVFSPVVHFTSTGSPAGPPYRSCSNKQTKQTLGVCLLLCLAAAPPDTARRSQTQRVFASSLSTGPPRDHDSQQNRSDNVFLFKVDAFYMGLKSKVCLVSANALALQINLNIQGCSVVSPPLHAPSRTPVLLPLLLSHNIPLPHYH
jgi:hypothetical protein